MYKPTNDLNEEYEELLMDWYGDDISLLDIDDIDLYDVVGRLTSLLRFWRTDFDCPLTSYEKLRRKYEALLYVHSNLIEAYAYLSDVNEQLVKACRNGKRIIDSTKINRGCSSAKERRQMKNDETSAA